MSTFCIPRPLAEKLKQAAKDGKIKIADLYKMESDARRAVFAKYTDEATAQGINAGFEQAMISKQKDALKKWANSTFILSAKKSEQFKGTIAKIDALDEMGVLTPKSKEAFLSDLVATKLGVTISAEEAKTISEKSAKLAELAKTTTEFGLPSLDYFKVRKEMDDYIKSRSPSSKLKIATSTIGRGTMLFSLKSPLVNIESNTVNAIMQSAERRLASNRYKGLNSDYAYKYMKFVNQAFQTSGIDPSRYDFSENLILGEEVTHSQGPGLVRKVGRFYEDVIFKQLMGAPDVAFSAFHFADSANLATSKIAEKEGLKGKEAKARALEIFKDATRFDPQTEEGQLVRSQAVSDATYATYTNDSNYSKAALGIRNVLNTITGNARFGDQMMPFVKTPANVIGAAIDTSGVLLPAEIYRMPAAIKQMKQGESAAFKQSVRRIVRGGLGLTFAFILSSLFDPEDFIGNYPVSEKERQLLELKNANTNSLRIGNKWVSLDYFGPLAAPLVGMLYAKKYAHGNAIEGVVQYYKGVTQQSLRMPGPADFGELVDSIKKFSQEKSGSAKETGTELANITLDYIRSRTIPAIVYDVAKATDTYERKADVKKDPMARIKSSIPGLRQTLPEDKTVFGDKRKAESPISILLFGTRVKTAADNKMLDELLRLEESDNLPSITDVSRTSPRFKALNQQIGDKKFEEAMDYFGSTLKQKFDLKINSFTYRRKSDEDKKKALDKIKQEVMEKTLRKYHYKKSKNN